MTETVQRYLDFVQDQIELFQQNTSLVSDNHITPRMINKALAEYGLNSAALISEYQRAKVNHYEIEAEFKDWWDEKVMEARDEVLANVEGKKWPAHKEYELVAKQNNLEQYREYQDQVTVAERKVSFLQRLLDVWKKQDQILVTIAYNMRAEMKALSLDDRVNAEEPSRKRRKLKEDVDGGDEAD